MSQLDSGWGERHSFCRTGYMKLPACHTKGCLPSKTKWPVLLAPLISIATEKTQFMWSHVALWFAWKSWILWYDVVIEVMVFLCVALFFLIFFPQESAWQVVWAKVQRHWRRQVNHPPARVSDISTKIHRLWDWEMWHALYHEVSWSDLLKFCCNYFTLFHLFSLFFGEVLIQVFKIQCRWLEAWQRATRRLWREWLRMTQNDSEWPRREWNSMWKNRIDVFR